MAGASPENTSLAILSAEPLESPDNWLEKLQQKDLLIEEQECKIRALEEELETCKKRVCPSLLNSDTYTHMHMQVNELISHFDQKDEKHKSFLDAKKARTRYWTPEEHTKFLEAVRR
jgi:hypothetical protein